MTGKPKNLFRNASIKSVKLVTQEVSIVIYWHYFKRNFPKALLGFGILATGHFSGKLLSKVFTLGEVRSNYTGLKSVSD
jgi:hypothetical protein